MGPSGLKNRQANNRSEHRLSVASKIWKCVLLQPDRESERILDGNVATHANYVPAEWFVIRDEESALDVVINVKSFSSIEGNLSVDGPAPASSVFEAGCRAHRLRSGKKQILYAPRTNVFAHQRHFQILAELALQADIGRGCEEFAD